MLSEKMCSELGIKTGDKITLNVDGKRQRSRSAEFLNSTFTILFI